MDRLTATRFALAINAAETLNDYKAVCDDLMEEISDSAEQGGWYCEIEKELDEAEAARSLNTA